MYSHISLFEQDLIVRKSRKHYDIDFGGSKWLEFSETVRLKSIEIASSLPASLMLPEGEPLPVRSIALIGQSHDLRLNYSKRFMKCNSGRWICCNIHYKFRHDQDEAFICCACKIVSPVDQLIAMLEDVIAIRSDGGVLVWFADIQRVGLALLFILCLLFDNPVPVRYVLWAQHHIVVGNVGCSCQSNLSV